MSKRTVIGRKPVLEILRRRDSRVLTLYVSDRARLSPELKNAIEVRSLSVCTVESAELDKLAEGFNHQGVAVVVEGSSLFSLKSMLDGLRRSSSRDLLVALDEVNDPQNLGAVIRAAEAAGASALIATKRRGAPLTSAVVRASAGASEFLPLCFVGNLRSALESLKSLGYWIVGTAPGGEARSLFETDLPDPLVLVLGSESRGLRRLTEETCDLIVRIPMSGSIQSLNVSQSAAVVLFEFARQRHSKMRGE